MRKVKTNKESMMRPCWLRLISNPKILVGKSGFFSFTLCGFKNVQKWFNISCAHFAAHVFDQVQPVLVS